MKMNKIRELACFALCALAAVVSCADTFPNAGGDIASAAEWGGPVPSEVTLDQTGTYTVGSDISLTKMILAGGHVTFDLTDPSSGKVTLASGVSGVKDGFYISSAGIYTTNFIKGGVWDFSNKGSFGITRTEGSGSSAQYASLTVSDGAVITNCGSVRVAFCKGPCNNQLILTGSGTTVHAPGSGYVMVSRYGGLTEGVKASLQILDGARLLYPGQSLYTDYTSGVTATSPIRSDSSVVVSGAGSLLNGRYLRLGGKCHTGPAVSIGNGASLQLNDKIFIGEAEYTSDCNVFITNNATASVGGIYVAAAANSHGHRLTVADGATLSVSDHIYLGAIGAYENSMIVSNANVSCRTFKFMNSESNTLYVCGSDATLACEDFFFGNNGMATNATIVLGGKSPVIAVNGSTGSNGTITYADTASTGTVTFRVPAGGYATTPFCFTGSANFRAGIALDVDLSECLARGKRSAFRSTLVQSGGTLTLNAAQLAAAQASVDAQLDAAECRGSLEKVENSLVLTVRPSMGIAIIIK